MSFTISEARVREEEARVNKADEGSNRSPPEKTVFGGGSEEEVAASGSPDLEILNSSGLGEGEEALEEGTVKAGESKCIPIAICEGDTIKVGVL